MMASVAQNVGRHSKATPRPVLGVDLDETVFNTVLVWMGLLSERFGAPGEMTPQELVSEFRYTDNVPGWKDNPEVERFMVSARRNPGIHESLPLIEGAAKSLEEIFSWADLAYMTMRPREVLDATHVSLVRSELPSGDVLMPPVGLPLAERPKWKGDLLYEMFPHVVGIIEDSVKVVLQIPKGYLGTVFLFGGEASPRDDIHVIECATWRDVERAVMSDLPRHLQVKL